MVALVIAGLATMFSVSQGNANNYFLRQFVFLAMGIVPFLICWRTPFEFWRRASNYLYATNVILLLLVLAKGNTKNGATRWIEIAGFQLQPSEISKLLMILTLCTYFYERRSELNQFRTYAVSFLHCLPIFVLVLIQPHMGSMLILLATWMTITIVAGVPWKYIGPSIGLVLALIFLVIKFPQLLPPYMRDRIFESKGAIHGKVDKSGKGYQQEQSVRCFALGGVFGTGYLKGEMKKGKYVPEQQTDFVFSVVGEEGGLVGCAIVLTFFAGLFQRIWWNSVTASDLYGRMIASGVLTVLGLHLIINLGMVLRVTPVIGLWLPFMSYGGTALWLCLSLVGLVLGVARENKKTLSF